MPTLFGMAARVAIPGITDANLVLPTVLLEQLPVWLGALALAAVFSTEVDTCDAVLFMVSTTVSKDVYKRHFNPEASDQHLLLVARVTAVAAGALGVVLSIYLGNRHAGADHLLCAARRHVLRPGPGRAIRATRGPPQALAAIAAGVTTLLVVGVHHARASTLARSHADRHCPARRSPTSARHDARRRAPSHV